MTDLQILPIDEAKKAAQPGIVGYVVQKGDSMWSIAKNIMRPLMPSSS